MICGYPYFRKHPYKDPVINQPGFHGSCHWWVFFPQLETLRRSLQLMHSAAFPILLPSGCSLAVKRAGSYIYIYIYIYIYEHIIDRYTCTHHVHPRKTNITMQKKPWMVVFSPDFWTINSNEIVMSHFQLSTTLPFNESQVGWGWGGWLIGQFLKYILPGK